MSTRARIGNAFKHGQLSLFPEIGRMSVTTRGKGLCKTCGWRVADDGHAPDCMPIRSTKWIFDNMCLDVRLAYLDHRRRFMADPDATDDFCKRVQEIADETFATCVELVKEAELRARRAEDFAARAQRNAVETLANVAHMTHVSIEGTFEAPRGCFVYILWGDDPDVPVYIGESTNVLGRLDTHLRDCDKGPLTRRVQLIQCRTEDAMHALERSLIRQCRPLFNVKDNGGPVGVVRSVLGGRVIEVSAR